MMRRMHSLLFLLPAGTVIASWTQKQGLNCYIGHGAVQIDDNSLGSMTVSACQEKCDNTPNCTGIVVDTRYGACWRRKDIHIENCTTDTGPEYDTWLKQSANFKDKKSVGARPRKVIHAEPPLPSDWQRHSSLLSTITFRLSLKQPGVQHLHRIAKQVSDPSDRMYGKYLTQNELDKLVAPPKHALDTVTNWATQVSCSVSVLREVVTISCASTTAESLLETTCQNLHNRVTEQYAVRCSDFSLPHDVHEVTQAVYGLHGLPMLPISNQHGRRLQFYPGELARVTPSVLASTYKIGGVTPSGSEKNRQAVVEFQGETMSTSDLDTFWSTYLPHVKPELGRVHKFVGDQNTGRGETEADLDIQYIMGVAPGILTEFWYFHPQDFCSDLKNWTQTILATENPPLVHSVSYGWQGNLTTLMGCKMENVNDVDSDFAKLAARGITIVFASGDSGSGYTPPRHETQCHPPPSVEEGVEIVGTVLEARSESSQESCCYIMSETGGVAWTYAIPDQQMCGQQLVVKGVSWDGEGYVKSGANSSDACCGVAFGMGREAWSYDAEHQDCVVFSTVRGRISDSNSVSGMGEPAQPGTCTVYSNITSKKKNPRATSAEKSAEGGVHLYPSWPASSPWVTAVGSTRFVNQMVGQPEMATDQFGSGGGFSSMFEQFAEQKDDIARYFKNAPQLPPNGTFSKGGRATPDVAALGEGYQVVIEGETRSIGGTSASAPMFAGLVSLLNEARLSNNMPPMGFLNPWLYKHADAFTDVILGDNAQGRGSGREPYGFNCIKGWDPVTGLGTPRFDEMLSAARSPSAGASADFVV